MSLPNFVGATIGRPFFCGCLRAINDRPYDKHPYENAPKLRFYFFLPFHLGEDNGGEHQHATEDLPSCGNVSGDNNGR